MDISGLEFRKSEWRDRPTVPPPPLKLDFHPSYPLSALNYQDSPLLKTLLQTVAYFRFL